MREQRHTPPSLPHTSAEQQQERDPNRESNAALRAIRTWGVTLAFLRDNWLLLAALGGAFWWFSSVARKGDVQKQIDKATAPLAQQIRNGFRRIDKAQERRLLRLERWMDRRMNRIERRVERLEQVKK